MLWAETKYLNLISHRLRNFKRKSEYLWNFACPFCGDSKRRKFAARGYVYRKGDKLNYDCKKCGAGMSVKNFIKRLDPELFREMQLELFTPPKRERYVPPTADRPQVNKHFDPFSTLIKIGNLPQNHFCRQMVEGRFIPVHVWDELYFTPAFYTWCGNVLPGRYKVPEHIHDDEPRLVIPFRNMKGEVTAFQGRQLIGEDQGKKYVYLALTKEEPLIWGLNNIDPNKTIYVLEGPIDAMFLPNAIACGGSNLTNDLSRLPIPQDRFVIVYDNEPRKVGTIAKIEQAIERGFTVCIWPKIAQKDVNDMVKTLIGNHGLADSCRYIFAKIAQNTYSGPGATVALSLWKRTSNDGGILNTQSKGTYRSAQKRPV